MALYLSNMLHQVKNRINFMFYLFNEEYEK